ncbi:MAG TPA: hypothetical protein VIN60_06520 [Anaerolineales bacterium]
MKFTMKPGLLRLIYQPVIGRAAIAGLVGRNRDRAQPAKGRFTHADVQAMLAQVWKEYDQLAPKVQKIPALGNQMNLYLSCVTFCCFQTLLGLGIERNYAIELISDMAWKVYEKWGAIPFMFARLRNRDPRGRMRFAVNAFLRFPFSPPGYLLERLPSEDGISFNIKKCIVAEYFQSQARRTFAWGHGAIWISPSQRCGAAGLNEPKPLRRGRRAAIFVSRLRPQSEDFPFAEVGG